MLARQTPTLHTLARLIVTQAGLDASAYAETAALAGRPIDFVAIDLQDTYYNAKNVGFDRVDAARCDYVAFRDTDCTPATDWLEQLLLPFA